MEKPVFTPINKKGIFDPKRIEPTMKSFIELARKRPANHSVMTLGRYHRIYNDEIVDVIKNKVIKLKAPITSFHLRTASGVWNLYREYETREDHPYKYGYGMLMHGAYHYIDLMVQILELNKLIYPNADFCLDITSYVAYPEDQKDRISKRFSNHFSDEAPVWSEKNLEVTIMEKQILFLCFV